MPFRKAEPHRTLSESFLLRWSALQYGIKSVSDIHVKTIHCDSISIHYSIIIATSTDLFQFQQEVIQKLTPLVAYSSLKEDGVYEK